MEIARRWAAGGVPAIRIDLEGIGDADGDERPYRTMAGVYSPRMTEAVLELLSNIEAAGIASRFVLVGFCSSAYWSLHAALADSRVAGAFLINLYAFYWSEALMSERNRRRVVAALRRGELGRVMRHGVNRQQVRIVRDAIRSGLRSAGREPTERAQIGEMTVAFDKLRDQATQLLFLLCEGEPLHDLLEREVRITQVDRWPNITVEGIPSRDHMLRAIWLQRHVEESLDRALERVLEVLPAGPGNVEPLGTH